jgi:hypothetical protein
MLGHAMDLYIPGVPLEQIRFAGLRLQRGGVGFYPTSGSPFVHLDTGNIRHWPRMTHDQLVKVFPDGRTVHIPSDGVPLKGYELAKADIEKRGNGDGAATIAKPSFLASLFGRNKSSAGDDEDDAAPVAEEPTPAVMAAAAKAAAPAPMPRAKPQMPAALQLASADVRDVQPKPAPANSADAKPETAADVINARGFWGNGAEAKQATATQAFAAIVARRAADAADPQSTAATSSPYQAMAYAPPANSSVDRANIVAGSAPMPYSIHPAALRDPNAATEINTIAIRLAQARGGPNQIDLAPSAARLAAAKSDDIWLRIIMLAPSARESMSVTVMGDTNMTQMQVFFEKPKASVTMGFTDDPMHGLATDHFSGAAIQKLELTPFALRTALLK